MVLGAGLGAPVDDEYASFGDTTDTKVLAERLDEGLYALDLLWSGEPVTYRGDHITIDDVVFLPAPVQRPRVPIWVGGVWPNKAPMRRATRWDGAIPAMAGKIEAARPAGGERGPGTGGVPTRLPGRERARGQAVRHRYRRHEPRHAGSRP